MPRTRAEGRGAGIRTTARLVSALLSGRELTRAQASALVDTKAAAIDIQMQVVTSEIPSIRRRKKGREVVWFHVPERDRWDRPSVIAACFGTSLASLFGSTPYAKHLGDLRARMVRGLGREALFRNIDKKFLFHSQGGDVGARRGGAGLDEIVDGLLEGLELTLRYVSFKGKSERWTVKPLAIVLYQHQLYLVAERPDRSLHPFRISRIKAASTGKPFTYPKNFDPEAIFTDSFGIWLSLNEQPVDVVLKLTNEWRTFVQTHRWHPSQTESFAADHVIVKVRCRLCEEVTAWALSFGDEAEVLQPDSLRRAVAGKLRRAAAIYDPDTSIG